MIDNEQLKFLSRNTLNLKVFLKLIIIGSIVGILTGIFGALFLNSLTWSIDFRNKHEWILYLLPLAGAFVSYLYYRYNQTALKGNNLIIQKINDEDVDIPILMMPLVFIGTVMTHLFGGSAGREGTGVQIGGSIAEFIGKKLKLTKYEQRMIVMSGVASGFGTIFGTPMAGAVFALEVSAIGIMTYEALLPAFAASFVGNIVANIIGVHHTHFHIGFIPQVSTGVVIKVIICAILFGFMAKIFSNLTHKLKEIFGEKFKNTSLKSFIGGILIVLLTFAVGSKAYLSLSLPLMNDAFSHTISPIAFILKTIFTSLTLGTGFQGGEVTPLFVIGSTMGNALSQFMHLPVGFLAGLGLIGVFAAASNTPLACFIMSIELFGSDAAIYMFMVVIISYMFSGHSGIYSSQKIKVSKNYKMKINPNSTLSNLKINK